MGGEKEEFESTLAPQSDSSSPISVLEDKTLSQSQRITIQESGVSQKHDHTDLETGTEQISHQFLTFKTEVATQPVWPDGYSINDAPEVPDYRKYDDPFGWSIRRKNFMTYMGCASNAIAAWAAGSYVYPADTLTAKWHISHIVYNLGVTVFTAGFGIAPMLLAPFSEINGRRPVFIASGLLFIVCQLGCAVTNSLGGMLVARFFLGCGASTFSTMVGGILADIWVAKDRNTPMVQFTGATLFGTGLGPLVSGAIAQHLLWRWVFWVQVVISGIAVGLVTFFFKETRGSVLLSRKARALNKYYEALEAKGALGVIVPHSETHLVTADGSTPPAPANDFVKPNTDNEPEATPTVVRLRYRVKSDEERASLLKMISISLYRPFHMLFTEPVVFWFSLWISFTWGVLYLQFASIPLVFRTNHNFNLQQTGYVFISMCIGAIISTVISIYQEKWGLKHFPQRFGASPEGRLYFTGIQSALLPAGLFMFGWSSYSSVHWIVPTIAVGIATMGIFSVFLAVFNYTADVYRMYASSALAGMGLCRNLLAGCFPLVTPPLFNNLGFQAASSLLGGIGAGLTLVPWVLVFFGPKIRKRSRIARNFIEEDEKVKENTSHVGEESQGAADAEIVEKV